MSFKDESGTGRKEISMNTNAKRTVMRLVAGVAAVATLMGTAACGSSNSSSSDDNTLTVSYWDDEMQPIKDFIKANPDIKVKQIRVPGDDYNTKLNQMIVGGTAPDVMLTQEADYVRFAKNGVTMKLDDKLKDLGIDKSDFQPSLISPTKWTVTTDSRKASPPKSCTTTKICSMPLASRIRPMTGPGTTTPPQLRS